MPGLLSARAHCGGPQAAIPARPRSKRRLARLLRGQTLGIALQISAGRWLAPVLPQYGLGLELQCDAAIASRNLPQPWRTLSSSLARSSAMTLALQPMPPSEYVLTSCRSPKRFTTNALSEGVGLNVQHVVMTASTELASMPWRRPGHGSVAAWHGQRRRLAPHRHGCLPCVHSRTRARGRARSTPWSRGATARRMLAQQQLAACRKDPEHQFCPAQPAGPAHGRGRCAGGAPSAPTAS